MEFKIVFQIGETKVTIKRTALGYLEALHNAKQEARSIEHTEQPLSVTVQSVTEL